MLDKIMESMGGGIAELIAGKAGISVDQAKEMLPMAQESLTEGVMSQVTGGNVSGLMGMFQGAVGGGEGLASNSIFGGIKAMFMQKVMTSMGLPESVAGLAAGAGMSSMIGGLAGKMQEDGDTDGIDASSIMNVLGVGGDAGGMLGKAAGMLGGAGGAAAMLGGLTGGGDGLMDKAKDALGGLTGDAAEGGEGAADAAGDVMDKAKDALGGLGKLFGK